MESVFTKKVLEDTLQVAEKDSSIEEFTVSRISKPGDNYTSLIYEIEVNIRKKLSDTTEKTYLIVKWGLEERSVSKEESSRVKIFNREINVYSKILPALENDLGLVQSWKAPVPKFYTGSNEMNKLFLVFEDLRVSGYATANKFKGLDFPHCRLVLEELSKFHARAFAMRKLHGDEALLAQFTVLQEETFNTKNVLLKLFITTIYQQVMTKIVQELDSVHGSEYARRMRQLQDEVFEIVTNSVLLKGPLTVICHGDLWTNNLMFKYGDEDKETPLSVKFIDWQLSRYATLTLDLNYFLYTSTNASLRQNHLDELLRLYHFTFHSSLSDLNLSFPEFTVDMLKTEMESTAMFGFIITCTFLPMIMAKTDDVPERSTSMNEDSLRKWIIKFVQNSLGNEYLRGRLYELAQEMADKNLI